MYAGIATKIPPAVATKASLIAGAMMLRLAFVLCPSLPNVCKIDTTVPKSPINGEVEAMIESHESPVVTLFSATFLHTFKKEAAYFCDAHFDKIELLLGVFAPSSIFSRESCSLSFHAER